MDTERRRKSLHEAELMTRVNRVLCERTDPQAYDLHCWSFACGLSLTVRICEDGDMRLAIQRGGHLPLRRGDPIHIEIESESGRREARPEAPKDGSIGGRRMWARACDAMRAAFQALSVKAT